MRAGRAGAVVALCAVLAAPLPLWAGDWAELADGGIQLRFQAGDRAFAGVLLQDLVSGRSEVARMLGGGFDAPMTVYLAPSEAAFREVTGGRIPHWGVGCAFPAEGLIVLKRLPGQRQALLQTARHEIAHILLHRLAPVRVPVWFNEGVAMWAAQEWRLQQSAEVTYAVLSGGLVPLEEIDGVLGFSSPRANLAYTESLLAALYLIHLGGPDAVAHMLEELAGGATFEVALFRVTGHTLRRFEQTWVAYVRGRFSLAALLTTGEALWFYATVLVLLAFVAVRARNRRLLERWEEEDPAAALPLRLRLQVHRREKRP